jgi:hypothetical protein
MRTWRAKKTESLRFATFGIKDTNLSWFSTAGRVAQVAHADAIKVWKCEK